MVKSRKNKVDDAVVAFLVEYLHLGNIQSARSVQVINDVVAEWVKKKLYIISKGIESFKCISPSFGTQVKLTFIGIDMTPISIHSTINQANKGKLFITFNKIGF